MDKNKLANISKSDDMSLIILCLFICSMLFEIYNLIFINYSLFKTVKRLIGNKRIFLRNMQNVINFHLFIPVLYEEEALKKIINHLLKIYYKNYKIYILTTQKIVLKHDNLQSIIDTALSLKKQYPHKIDVIHYPYTFGNKASQLNYALQFIQDEPDSYIGIYDVDSVPDLNTLSEVEQEILKLQNKAIVIQQASLFFENMQHISSYMKLEALLQTKRSLGIEIPTYINTVNQYKNPFYSIPYCVGHGLFVKTKFILEQNGFLEPIEDVPFGVRLAAKRLPIIPCLHTFDNSEVPKNILNLFKQSGMWFYCTLSGFKEAWSLKQTKNRKSIGIIFKSFLDIYSWVYFLIYIITGVYLSVQGTYWIWCVSIPLVFANALISIHYVLKVYESKKGFSVTLWNKISFILLYPIRESIRGLAPLCYIFSLLKLKKRRKQNGE